MKLLKVVKTSEANLGSLFSHLLPNWTQSLDDLHLNSLQYTRYEHPCSNSFTRIFRIIFKLFLSPQAIVVFLTSALAWMPHFKVFRQSFVMGKALSGKLSCTWKGLVEKKGKTKVQGKKNIEPDVDIFNTLYINLFFG